MDRGTEINVAGLEEDSITNGPGLRFVMFVQGCPHNCVGCHNPETHHFGQGKNYTVDELYKRIRGNPLQTGVTFSGGEPFCQPKPLTKLGRLLKSANYDLAIYTGFTFENLLASNDIAILDLLRLADILIDGKFDIERRDLLLHFRGSDNQRILDVKRSLEARKAVLSTDPDWAEI